MRNQTEIDTQIASQLQAEEKARHQEQNPQGYCKVGRYCSNRQQNILCQQNMQPNLQVNQKRQNQAQITSKRNKEHLIFTIKGNMQEIDTSRKPRISYKILRKKIKNKQ